MNKSPLFVEFEDDVEIMRSLARPRKITLTGSDGKTYIFLGKPKDDLRKDARLMDFNAIINRQLKSNSESRRRQLCMLCDSRFLFYFNSPHLQTSGLMVSLLSMRSADSFNGFQTRPLCGSSYRNIT